MNVFEWAKLNTALCIVTFLCLGITWVTLCLPGSLISFCGGILFYETFGLPGIFLGWFLSTINQFIAGQLSFFISRYVLYDILRNHFETNKILNSLEASIKECGWKIAILIRAIGVLPTIVSNYGLSATSIRHRDFTIGFIGGWLWELTMVYYGYCAGDLIKALLGTHETNYKDNILMVVLIVLTMGITVLASIFAYFEIRKVRESAEVSPHVEMIDEIKLETNVVPNHTEIKS